MGLFDDNLAGRARDLDQDGDPDSGSEYVVWALAGLVLVALTFWIAFWVSSFLWGFDILPLRAFLDLPKAIVYLPTHPLDVSAGWSKPYQPLIGPSVLFWLVLGLTISYVIKGVRAAWKRYNDWRYPPRGGAHWASDADLEVEDGIIERRLGLMSMLAQLLARWQPLGKLLRKLGMKGPNLGVIFGEMEGSGRAVHLQLDNHAIVVAGTRSGKTAGLMTPALLTYNGAVMATSVKDDLVKGTIVERKKRGRVWIFDPGQSLPVRTGDPEIDKRNNAVVDPEDIAYWSPLDRAKDWREALRTADVLLATSMGGDSGGSNMQFFKNMAGKVLPVLLYSAAVMDQDMRRVLRWLNRINDKQTHAEIDAVLRWKDNLDALDIWIGFLKRDQKLRGDIGATVESAVVVYQDPRVQQTSRTQDAPKGQHINTADFIDGGQNTLYVVAPVSEQNRLEPLFVTLMQGILTDIADKSDGDLDTPLLVALDEAANIAGMPQLPTFLATIGSKHVSIISAWQDFSQIESKYGKQKGTVLNNSRGLMLLPGVKDPETLDFFTKVGGEEIVESVSVSRSEKDPKGRNLSVGEQRKPLLDTKTLREQEFGHGIIVYGNMPPIKIKLRMFFKDPVLLRRAKGMPEIPAWKLQARKLPLIGRLVRI
jgi:type IV secretory pathway TraG/TraD family ATPase VirD4